MANPRQFLSGIDATNNLIINVASPTAATNAANKGYVDNLINGLSWKNDVRVATTTAGTLASSFANGSTVDGQTLATNDRILIKNQASPIENGIYTVNASGAPTRSLDANTSAELNNAVVTVLQGTVNTLTTWIQTTNNPVIGTSNIVWATYAAGAVYTAGNGLQLVSTTFSVLLPANSGLSASGTGLTVVLQTNPGLVLGSTGLAVSLNATNPALSLTGGLAVIAGYGITLAADSVAVDTTKIASKYATSIGDGSTLVYTVTHGLNTLDVLVQVYANASGTQVEADVIHASTTTVTIGFTTAPTTNQYRVVVMG